MSKKQLRRRIEVLEDTIRVMRDLDRYGDRPSREFVPLTIDAPNTTTTTSNAAPWCFSCQRFHIPNVGACTGTFSYTWPIVVSGGTTLA